MKNKLTVDVDSDLLSNIKEIARISNHSIQDIVECAFIGFINQVIKGTKEDDNNRKADV